MLIHGNCIDYMSKMENKSVDLTITDIPYGEVNRKSNGLRNLDKEAADIVTFDLTDFVNELCRVTKGSIYVFCGTEQVSDIRKLLVKNGLSTRLCIWEKTNPSPMNGDKLWLSGIECCVYGKFKNAVFHEHCRNTVFKYPVVHKRIHPTQKPLALIEYLILVSSNEGDIVFDPCAGSATTGVAAVKNNRKFLGIELNKEYYDLAEKRLANVS